MTDNGMLAAGAALPAMLGEYFSCIMSLRKAKGQGVYLHCGSSARNSAEQRVGGCSRKGTVMEKSLK